MEKNFGIMKLYADDMQLYVRTKPGPTDVSYIMSCLAEIKNWMSKHVLQLNDKLEIIIITPPGLSTHIINSHLAWLPHLTKGLHPKASVNLKHCDHITPILAALHWLPVSFRTDLISVIC